MYLGLDRLRFPGTAVLDSLRATGRISFVGVYLAPAPSQPSTAWMPHIAGLVADGWGVVPIYVGQQAPGGPGSHVLTAEQGETDAAEAVDRATAAGLAENSVVYLDVEAAGTLGAAHLGYVRAWVDAMRLGTYRPGVYCAARQTAAQVTAEVGRLPVWVFRTALMPPMSVDLDVEEPQDPAASGYQQALVWQYRSSLAGRRVDLTWTGEDGGTRTLEDVDLDASIVADPSNPQLPSPAILDVTPTSGAAGDTVRITGFELGTVTDVAFGTTSAADVALIDESTVEAVVPGGLPAEAVRIVATNRWGLSGETGEIFTVIADEPVDDGAHELVDGTTAR